MKKILTNPIALLVIALVAILFVFPYYQNVFSSAVHTQDGKPQEFYIYKGWDYIRVGEELLAQKIISDPEGFHWVAEKMNYPNHVYSGRYIIEDGISNRDLVTLLRSGKQEPVNFTFVKFRTKDQLADYVGEKLMMDSKELKDGRELRDGRALRDYRGMRDGRELNDWPSRP